MKNTEEKKGKSATTVSMLVGAGVILVVLGLIAVGVAGSKIYKNRTALQFAMDKPEIVNAVLKQYNDKQKQIDADFLKTSKSSQDVLIETLTEELKK